MKRDRLARFWEMSAALLFAMLGVIIFGWPTGSVAAGALAVWVFTFIHLNGKICQVLEELRHVREMSKMRDDDASRSEGVSMVSVSDEEEKKEW